MNTLRKYDIGIAQLSNKTHQFDFELDDAFFALFDQSYIRHGHLKATVLLHKTDLLIRAEFIIDGEVQLTCDRSLEEFMHPLHVHETIQYRYGAEETELSEDLIQITPETQHINVAQHLFDFIGLAIPMKKLHPRYAAEEARFEEDETEGRVIFSTSTDKGMIEDDEDQKDESDPRWDALRNISNN